MSIFVQSDSLINYIADISEPVFCHLALYIILTVEPKFGTMVMPGAP